MAYMVFHDSLGRGYPLNPKTRTLNTKSEALNTKRLSYKEQSLGGPPANTTPAADAIRRRAFGAPWTRAMSNLWRFPRMRASLVNVTNKKNGR